MKKVFVGILTMMYMTVSSGIVKANYYCMGKEAGFDFFGNSRDKCGRCGMKEKNKAGCCHDEHKFYKLNDSHKNVSNTISFAAKEILLKGEYFFYNWQILSSNCHTGFYFHPPPASTGPSYCILNCTFRL